jgi:hypothetical protein
LSLKEQTLPLHFIISANKTERQTLSTESLIVELDARTAKLDAKINSTNNRLNNLDGTVNKNDKSLHKFSETAAKAGKGIAMVAGAAIAGAAAFTAYATAQGRAMRETEALAAMAGLTANEFKKLSFVMGTTGISGEKFGDIMKDTQERIGDFLSEFEKTGKTTGTFNDFSNVMNLTQKDALALAREFELLSGDQVLQRMVTMMQEAGKSTQTMSFALEGMASDATRLIPVMLDNGKAAEELKKRFDEINIPLSDEEKQQFIDLAANVDLAQSSFVNFLNNAISPFLPAINKAGEALADFFAAASVKIDLNRIIDNNDLADEVQSLMEVEKLLVSVNELVEIRKELGTGGGTGRANKKNLQDAKEAQAALQERKKALIEITAEKEKQSLLDLEALKGNLKGGGGKGGAEKDASDLESIQDRFKSEIELLTEKYEEEKSILDRAVEDELKRNELKLELLNEFEENKKEIKDEGREADLEAERDMLAEKAELELKAGKAKIKLEQSVTDNAVGLLRMIGGENKAAALIALGIQKATALSANATATLSGSLLAYASQLIPGDPTSVIRAEAARNYTLTLGSVNAGLIAATGLGQAAGITKGGGSGGVGGQGGGGATQQTTQPIENFNDQGTTITDISGGDQSTQRLVIEFNDELVDAISRHIQKSQSDGRT